jgi:hypothetical protein
VSLRDSSRNRILGVSWDENVPDDAPVVSISVITATSDTLRIEVSEAAAAGGRVYSRFFFPPIFTQFVPRSAAVIGDFDVATAKLKTKIDQAVFFGDKEEARRSTSFVYYFI